MSSIKLVGSTSGEITIAAPAVAGTNTLTLPANTGTIVTSASGVGDLPSTIAGPAFSAYLSANQTITTSTYTKLQIDTVDFDTSSDYDNTTNYRFTPSVAGYYQVTALASTSALANAAVHGVNIYKNGTNIARGARFANGATSGTNSVATKLIYMNGTTDYLEFYVLHNQGSNLSTIAGVDFTYATAVLVRAA